MVVAFVLGVAVGSGGKGSTSSAEAAAAPSAPAAAVTTDAAPSVAAPSASAAPASAEPSASASSASTETRSKADPDATTHGVTETDAVIACTRYGEDHYPYGFKDHYMLGVIAQRIEKNRWFIKHEVTIKNAFNAERDTVFECTVGGTHAIPTVREFFVYS